MSWSTRLLHMPARPLSLPSGRWTAPGRRALRRSCWPTLAGIRRRRSRGEVAAGLPRRMPDVMAGFSGSNGMAFLLAVMWARSRLASADLPVTRLGRRSTSMRWLSVPPVTMSQPCIRPASAASAWALSTTCAGVDAELGAQRLAERDRLGGDDVHQRAALQTGEHGRVELLAQVEVVAQDHPAARATERLVGRRGDDVGVGQRRRVDAASDHEPGEMGHVDQEIGADLVGQGGGSARNRWCAE